MVSKPAWSATSPPVFSLNLNIDSTRPNLAIKKPAGPNGTSALECPIYKGSVPESAAVDLYAAYDRHKSHDSGNLNWSHTNTALVLRCHYDEKYPVCEDFHASNIVESQELALVHIYYHMIRQVLWAL